MQTGSQIAYTPDCSDYLHLTNGKLIGKVTSVSNESIHLVTRGGSYCLDNDSDRIEVLDDEQYQLLFHPGKSGYKPKLHDWQKVNIPTDNVTIKVVQGIGKEQSQSIPKTISKAAQCRAAYAKMIAENASRSAIIACFIEIGCTKAGANTYYYNCSKK